MPKPKCSTCQDMGYIPFAKPDGTISRFAQIVCPDCGGYNHERDYADANIPDRQPDDFDFPMSYSFYRMLCREHGWDDPGPDEPVLQLKSELQEVATTVRHVSVYDFASKRQVAKIYQLEGQVRFLNKKVTEMRTEKQRKRGRY